MHDYAVLFFGERDGTSVVMWLGYGTGWDCGACYLRSPTAPLGLEFNSQIFMPADADEAYWSGAVLAHELGHWVMATYGVSPGRRRHAHTERAVSSRAAWSEGFATWFSSVVRDESFYYDKQNGMFLWVDLAQRSYSGGASWYRPDPRYGLEQLIDENEVARMLLGLTNDQTFATMFAALSSPRMTVAPFLRGYLRRTWNGLDQNGLPLPAWSTDASAPDLADYLDTLVCSGAFTAGAIDVETEPGLHYPYPSRDPLCRRGRVPLSVTWKADGTAEVHWFVPLESDLVLRRVPDGVARIVPAATPPGVLELGPIPGAAMVAGGDRTSGLEVTTGGEGWSLRGVVPRRPTRGGMPPRRDGPRVHIGPRELGRGSHRPTLTEWIQRGTIRRTTKRPDSSPIDTVPRHGKGRRALRGSRARCRPAHPRPARAVGCRCGPRLRRLRPGGRAPCRRRHERPRCASPRARSAGSAT